ncbi:glycerophosphodiester phosphodiesterase [Streptomyces thermodiastaticus]|uniref:glycerophosphodiester phosphodiesterase n=1 Tax=Streptomyces thermodiastaticus TaxID=44061 RepID=UPI001672963E|nr:glycerophosphodiester phosphodiesterase family protein [Streptomyces thermodiastaticus]MCE7548380.1 glycerophosphodiester phosphodiesterase [Streptomyces thermodiastaticus]GHF63279.1 hydrolase [Streptomyces thermodiastaticus]
MHVRAVAAAVPALLAATLLSPAGPARAAAAPQRPELVAGAPQRPVVVAHRGASAYAPENTLPAVDKAAALGIGWVENDVQRTKDGELVVLHDDTLVRTTDAEQVFPDRAPWRVRDFTAAEIARLDAGSWFSPAFAGTRVPTLRQYLRRAERDRTRLLLEVKHPELYPGIERQILDVLGSEGWLDRRHLSGRLIVQSFSADSVRTVHALRPAVETAFLGSPATADLPRYAAFADAVNPQAGGLSAAYVSAVHALTGPHGRPLRVFTWTVDSPSVARTAAGYGVDGIISDKPDVVSEALDAA